MESDPFLLEIVAREAPRYGVRLSTQQIDMLGRYGDLLERWSGRANLVGDASSETVQRRHFLESIALGAALREREVLRPASAVIDVGAGAGFPGLVLKIVWPGIRLALLEATAKKTAFLAAVVDTLALDDVRVITGRAEDAAHNPELRGAYDLVVARAVAPLPALLELTLPFAKVGGRVVTPKGARAEAEVAAAAEALRTLGGKAFVVPFDVPGPPQRIVAVLKQRDTPAEYPRRTGVPVKRPL
jgi:16S rRNA (guanine527-N7)-methyltransferase